MQHCVVSIICVGFFPSFCLFIEKTMCFTVNLPYFLHFSPSTVPPPPNIFDSSTYFLTFLLSHAFSSILELIIISACTTFFLYWHLYTDRQAGKAGRQGGRTRRGERQGGQNKTESSTDGTKGWQGRRQGSCPQPAQHSFFEKSWPDILEFSRCMADSIGLSSYWNGRECARVQQFCLSVMVNL